MRYSLSGVSTVKPHNDLASLGELPVRSAQHIIAKSVVMGQPQRKYGVSWFGDPNYASPFNMRRSST